MSCSFCHFTGHNIVTCQSTVLLRLLDEKITFVRQLEKKPFTNTYSRAEILHNVISSMTVEQLKGIACKLHIKITGKNKVVLISLIVKKMWFNPFPATLTTDINYLSHLNRIISGVNERVSWNQYIANNRSSAEIIQGEIRDFNLNWLIEMKDSFEEALRNISRWNIDSAINALRNTRERRDLFGEFITFHDICQHIPLVQMRSYGSADELVRHLLGDQYGHLEDVVLQQKLDVTCAYDKDLVKSEEECAICFSDTKCDTMLDCEHMFCIDCVTTTVAMTIKDHRKKLTCAMCRSETKCIISSDEAKIDNLLRVLI